MELNQKSPGHLETPLQLKHPRNYMAEIVMVLIMIGLLYWVVVRPKAADLGAKRDQLSQLTDEQRNLSDEISKMQGLISNMRSQPDQIAKLDEALPLQNSTLRLNLLVNTLANSAGVTVRDVNFVDKQDDVIAGNTTLLDQPFDAPRTLQSTQGSVTVAGTYDNLQAFLRKIEGNSRLMDIQDMEISGIDKDTLSLKLDLLTYSYE